MRQAQYFFAVSALLLLAGSAEAKPQPHATAEPAAEPVRHQISQDDLKSIETVPVSLKAAIEAAEAKTGGTVVDISFVADPATSKYEATLVKDQSILRARIDAGSGAVDQLPSRKSEMDDDAINQARALQPDLASLAQIVAVLEEQRGAKAVEADVKLFGDYVIYDMQMAKNGAPERVAMIEAKSGRPIGNPRALDPQ
ncbi:MAG: hypothetical protein JWM77_851 [Rhodospirillales bacterium]|nr:hypothetical protein [Rhodospirillales bacterium]